MASGLRDIALRRPARVFPLMRHFTETEAATFADSRCPACGERDRIAVNLWRICGCRRCGCRFSLMTGKASP